MRKRGREKRGNLVVVGTASAAAAAACHIHAGHKVVVAAARFTELLNVCSSRSLAVGGGGGSNLDNYSNTLFVLLPVLRTYE